MYCILLKYYVRLGYMNFVYSIRRMRLLINCVVYNRTNMLKKARLKL